MAEFQAEIEEFVQTFARYQQDIQAYLLTLVPNRSDCDDLMQETSVALWRKWSDFDRQRAFFPWACGIAFIEVLRYRRHSSTQRMWFSEDVLETLAVDFMEASELLDLRRAALQSCLEKLDTQDRVIIESRYRDGTTVQDVAHELHRPVGSLYKAVARIRERLQMCIEGTIARQSHP
jgi:RNA polymerase sigma-70 factor (ECF subfamily)